MISGYEERRIPEETKWLEEVPLSELKDTDCCSFCAKTRKEVKHLVSGPTQNVFICGECNQLVTDIISHVERMESEEGAKLSISS